MSSLLDFNKDSNSVTFSPRSQEACRILGIKSTDLLSKPRASFQSDEFPLSENVLDKLVAAHEVVRKSLVRDAIKERSRILRHSDHRSPKTSQKEKVEELVKQEEDALKKAEIIEAKKAKASILREVRNKELLDKEVQSELRVKKLQAQQTARLQEKARKKEEKIASINARLNEAYELKMKNQRTEFQRRLAAERSVVRQRNDVKIIQSLNKKRKTQEKQESAIERQRVKENMEEKARQQLVLAEERRAEENKKARLKELSAAQERSRKAFEEKVQFHTKRAQQYTKLQNDRINSIAMMDQIRGARLENLGRAKREHVRRRAEQNEKKQRSHAIKHFEVVKSNQEKNLQLELRQEEYELQLQKVSTQKLAKKVLTAQRSQERFQKHHKRIFDVKLSKETKIKELEKECREKEERSERKRKQLELWRSAQQFEKKLTRDVLRDQHLSRLQEQRNRQRDRLEEKILEDEIRQRQLKAELAFVRETRVQVKKHLAHKKEKLKQALEYIKDARTEEIPSDIHSMQPEKLIEWVEQVVESKQSNTALPRVPRVAVSSNTVPQNSDKRLSYKAGSQTERKPRTHSKITFPKARSARGPVKSSSLHYKASDSSSKTRGSTFASQRSFSEQHEEFGQSPSRKIQFIRDDLSETGEGGSDVAQISKSLQWVSTISKKENSAELRAKYEPDEIIRPIPSFQSRFMQQMMQEKRSKLGEDDLEHPEKLKRKKKKKTKSTFFSHGTLEPKNDGNNPISVISGIKLNKSKKRGVGGKPFVQ